MDAIFNRHSVRKYKSVPVESEKIELLLTAGMSAPSACSQFPWEFYVVEEKEKLIELSKCSPFAGCVKSAPLAIVPCYRTVNLRARDFVLQDMSACTENILIEAENLGLGAVWLGIAPVEKRQQKIQAVLNIPKVFLPFSIISIGYSSTENFSTDSRYNKNLVHYV